jgi:hypothetical protein
VARHQVVTDVMITITGFPTLALQEALRDKRAEIAEVVGRAGPSAS